MRITGQSADVTDIHLPRPETASVSPRRAILRETADSRSSIRAITSAAGRRFTHDPSVSQFQGRVG